jgi:butyrophilin
MILLECGGLSLLRFTHYCLSVWATEPFFPQVSPWKPAFLVTLTVMGLLVLGTSYLLGTERFTRLNMQEIIGDLQREKDELQKTKEDALKTISKSP